MKLKSWPNFLRNRTQVYNLYTRCKTYNQAPSEVFRVEAEWVRYSFDQHVWGFGMKIDSKLQERKENGKPKHDLEGLLLLEQVDIDPTIPVPGVTIID